MGLNTDLKPGACLEENHLFQSTNKKQGWSQNSDKYLCERKPLQYSGWLEIMEVNNFNVMSLRYSCVWFFLSSNTGQKDQSLLSC